MNIVIVGGGTAGWLAALFISKIKPEHSVTVIESSEIGIVGAGEGSTGFLSSVIKNHIWNFDTDIMEFLIETGATLKYGIKHIGWTQKIDHSYYGPVAGSETASNGLDYLFAMFLANDPSKFHNCCDYGLAMDRQISGYNKFTKSFDNVGSALHFDAHKVGQYLKKICLKNKNIIHIDNKILDVQLDNKGYINSLLLESEQKICGDFFIDASGFKRILMTKLNVRWKSYRENLPVNSAMPFLLSYKENESPEPWTTAWAQSSGWMWQIPVLERKGCGYVFDDNFITADQAQEEIEKTLGQKIDPIRILKFETGRCEKAIEKNCLAIGLSMAFAEPLEATSIHATIIQLINFVFDYLKPTLEETLTQGSVNLYNKQTLKMYDDFKEFLVIHYMGGRNDSDFWKYISSGSIQTDFSRDIIDMCKVKFPNYRNIDEYFGGAGWGLWSYVLAGTGILTQNIAKKEISELSKTIEGQWLINQAQIHYNDILKKFNESTKYNYSYKEFITFLRSKHGS